MTTTDDPLLTAYQSVQVRIREMAGTATAEQLRAPVPSCSDWTAGELVSHLAGLTEDWVSGDLDPYGSDEWAAAQVARFKGSSLADVLAAWDRAMVDFAELTESPLGGTPSMWAFGDAVVHEADIRPALAPGTRVPDEAVALGVKAGIARWRGELAAAELPPLKITATGLRHWWVGEETAEATTVEADQYELFRALFGRRSRRQAKSWNWSGDAAPYLAVDLPTPFRWSAVDLVD
jgi:uncharacterized protein (TIGR03083 family)